MPLRIAEVLRDIDADVVALQEVIGAGPAGAGQAEEIGAALGMGWVMASVRHLRSHLFGNVVLSRFPIVHHSQYDLSWRTCEPRACQRADLDLGRTRCCTSTTSTSGTAVLERRYQAPRLASFVHDHRIEGPKIILGDFNEWMRGLATQDAQLALRKHRHPRPPEAAPHLSGHLPCRSPRSHLLRGRRRGARRRAAAHPQGADGLRSPAARRQSADRLQELICRSVVRGLRGPVTSCLEHIGVEVARLTSTKPICPDARMTSSGPRTTDHGQRFRIDQYDTKVISL